MSPPPASPLQSADADNAEWLRCLRCGGAQERDAQARLHEMLLRVARREARRRAASLRLFGPEVDDIADQAAGDALLAVITKLDDFRGESKFTTWAYKFVIFEVAGKVNRHHWQRAGVPLTGAEWERLPDRLGMQPDKQAEWRDLMSALRASVEDDLTVKQREVFVALVLQRAPIDVLAVDLDTNRNAIYKVMFDARRKIRAALVAQGYVTSDASRQRDSAEAS